MEGILFSIFFIFFFLKIREIQVRQDGKDEKDRGCHENRMIRGGLKAQLTISSIFLIFFTTIKWIRVSIIWRSDKCSLITNNSLLFQVCINRVCVDTNSAGLSMPFQLGPDLEYTCRSLPVVRPSTSRTLAVPRRP